MNTPTIYTATPADLSPPVQTDSFCVDLVLATDYQKLKDEFKQLAAENVALKNLARGWANATDDRLFEEFGEISHDSIDDCEAELKIICPATDRIVAGIKADEEKAVLNDLLRHMDKINIENLSSPWELSSEVVAFVNSRLLREGADK